MASVVLLVEPNKLFAQTCDQMFAAYGCEVNVCGTAAAAIASADEHKPDIVVLELALAGHNGIEFLYEFRSYGDWVNIPVVIYSHIAPGRFELMSKQLDLLGVNRYFDKSQTNLADLVAAVKSELINAPTGH